MKQDFMPTNHNSTIFLILADDILLGFLVFACIIPTFILPCIKLCKSSIYPRQREDSILSTESISDAIIPVEAISSTKEQTETVDDEEPPTYGQLHAYQ